MKFAYFNPTVFAIEEVPQDTFLDLKELVKQAHQHNKLDDSDTKGISIRGGQQIQLVPNDFDSDTTLLKNYIESICSDYIRNLLAVNGSEEFDLYRPVLTSAWTIRQEQDHYQALHSHQAHISGNIYIDIPNLDFDSKESDSCLEFVLPIVRNPSTFHFVDRWKFKPKIGNMVIFPSYLSHTVYPWKGQGNRTILAWDVQLIQN